MAKGLSIKIGAFGMRPFSTNSLSSYKSSWVRSMAKAGIKTTPPTFIVSSIKSSRMSFLISKSS